MLVHVDTEQTNEKLVNRRLAYVAVSRGRQDAQIYTNDKSQLAERLARDVSQASAMKLRQERGEVANQTNVPSSSAPSQAVQHGVTQGLGMGQ